MPSAAPTRSPAVIRGSREAMTTDASAASARPVRALKTSAGPTAAVPWVMSTTARAATRSTSAVVTAAAPVRDDTVAGRAVGVVAVTAIALLRQRRDDGVGVRLHRAGAAEHPDAVVDAVDVTGLHERQRLPDGVVGELLAEGVAAGVLVVADVDELDLPQVGQSLDVGGRQAVRLVALLLPGVLQSEPFVDGSDERTGGVGADGDLVGGGVAVGEGDLRA